MNKIPMNRDFIEAGMIAWNTLSSFTEEEYKVYDDIEEFSDFYKVVMTKLLEETEEE